MALSDNIWWALDAIKGPSGKYFENAPKFKSSPQNNGISAALLKQNLCGSGM
jgi:hypothetical protein